MIKTILSQDRETSNPPSDPIDTALSVDARFAGGTISLDAEQVDWLGDTLLRVEIPGLNAPLMLRTHEARDLGLALLNLAAHIEEDASRTIRRRTEPGEPEFAGIGGGL